MIVFPNAKINIGLNVVEKRTDGFHNIESVFYPIINLFDVLEVVEHHQLEFASSGIEIPGNESSNLCLKAFQLIKVDFDIPNVNVHLLKNIQIGAGLGGGSADGAYMLKALNELFMLNLSSAQLIKYAKKLGSDCAFFIDNKPVYAYHKGGEFEAINLDLSSYDVKVEYPEIHIGTEDAYSGIAPVSSKENLKELIKQPVDNWRLLIRNDFEKSVFPKYPSIAKLKQKMYSDGAIYASMTGSGSAVYGIFNK
jgi:4-diphosphocytidyl-2-C-methyl-D-erythritol kinase